jgi:catalase
MEADDHVVSLFPGKWHGAMRQSLTPDKGSKKMDTPRRRLLAGIGGLSLGAALTAVQPRQANALSVAGSEGGASEAGEDATAIAVNDALEGAYGRHLGQRRNHTKGFGTTGYFVGTKEAAQLSRSALFDGDRIEVIGRFSIAGGDPTASDSERSPRGMGLEFRLKGGHLHHITMIHTPMFFARTPSTFLDKFLAISEDVHRGKATKLTGFMKQHPDNAAQGHFLETHNPPASYANSAFYGIHTFRFVDHAGKTTNVRFRFVPEDGVKWLTDAQLAEERHDFLEAAFRDRVKEGPVRWEMMVTIGEPGDPEDDPTVLWPAGRREIKAGTLTLTSYAPDRAAGAYKINFDPMQMADGIEPTDDPVLRFRSSSYAISHSRRQVEVAPAETTGTNKHEN